MRLSEASWVPFRRQATPEDASSLQSNEALRSGLKDHENLREQIIELARDRVDEHAGQRDIEPKVDAGWTLDDGLRVIVEVKSITEVNEAHQWRIGLGQVIEYRHRMSQIGSGPVVAYVAVSQPSAHLDVWRSICESVGVRAVDPTCLDHLFDR